VTLVVAGAEKEAALDAAGLDSRLTEALETASLRDAVSRVAGATGLPRKLVYRRALALTKSGGEAAAARSEE
jgi:16S rRNA (cytidine1402-2'-O)-methyltransferase